MSIHHLSTKIIVYFLLIVFPILLSYPLYAIILNNFYQQTNHPINIYSTQQLKNKYSTHQSPLKRHDIHILSRKEIPKVMKSYGIDGVGGFLHENEPMYNKSGSKLFNWEFQNPPKDLIAVYFKPRNNPFKLEHPYSSNYKYTLEDLLKHEIAIEEAYIFWDKTYNPKFIDLKPIDTKPFSATVQSVIKNLSDFNKSRNRK